MPVSYLRSLSLICKVRLNLKIHIFEISKKGGKSNGVHLHFGLTEETDKSYTWNIVKELAIDPQPLMRKKSGVTYYGQMFKNMPLLSEEPSTKELEDKIKELTNELEEKNELIKKLQDVISKIKELLNGI